MNLYTSARKYVDLKRLRRLSEEKIKNKEIAEAQKQQETILAELKQIEMETSSKFCNWRSELEEGMTTAGMGMRLFSGEGDTDLETVTQDAQAVTDGSGGTGGTYSYGDYHGTVAGGFAAAGFVLFLDTSKYDTIKFNISGGNSTETSLRFGETPNTTEISTSNGENTITIPSNRSGSKVMLLFTAQKSGADGLPSEATITDIKFQRRSPLNVIVGLDDPEANNFVRTNPHLRGLSAEQREKKLLEMLEAGDEYLLKQLGMTGSSARPSETVLQQSFMDIQAGGERITKRDGKTINDTTRGIENGKMDGNPIKFKGLTNAELKALAAKDGLPYYGTAGNDQPSSQNKSKSSPQQSFMDIRVGGGYPPKPTNTKTSSGVKDYGTDLTPLSDNPYGTEVAQVASTELAGMGINPDTATPSILAAALGITVYAATELRKILDIWQSVTGGFADAGAGPTTTGRALPGTGVNTPEQQKEIDAAGKELSDARQALNDAEDSGNQTAIDMARERLNRANNNRTRQRQRNRNQRNLPGYQGESVIHEKKKLKSPKDISKKIPGYYDGKPAPLGFPMDEPPKMVNGFHPDLVDGKKVADRFNKMDPISARSMPATGNPHIDKKVEAARKKKK